MKQSQVICWDNYLTHFAFCFLVCCVQALFLVAHSFIYKVMLNTELMTEPSHIVFEWLFPVTRHSISVTIYQTAQQGTGPLTVFAAWLNTGFWVTGGMNLGHWAPGCSNNSCESSCPSKCLPSFDSYVPCTQEPSSAPSGQFRKNWHLNNNETFNPWTHTHICISSFDFCLISFIGVL